VPTLADALTVATADSRILLDADASAGVAVENPLQPIQQALTERVIRELRLHFASGERYRYLHRHRWRFWRKVPAKPKT
jgi:hypothetical protein